MANPLQSDSPGTVSAQYHRIGSELRVNFEQPEGGYNAEQLDALLYAIRFAKQRLSRDTAPAVELSEAYQQQLAQMVPVPS